MLADGETIPSPGQSVIVKMLSDYTPNDAGSLAHAHGSTGIRGDRERRGRLHRRRRRRRRSRPRQPARRSGRLLRVRILGIPGNQTTGQQRVPVIITSLRDDTVGTTVRGVVMYTSRSSRPGLQPVINPARRPSLTTPAAGDGGYIYIGGNSLTEYDPTDPFDGSLINNADISYMTRIEVQGGGIIDTINASPARRAPRPSRPPTGRTSSTGYLAPVNQLNSAMTLTISDSNLADFSDAGVFVHPDAVNALYRDWTGITSTVAPRPFPARGGLVGQPVDLYMYNDTISNSAQGVHINSRQATTRPARALSGRDPEHHVLQRRRTASRPVAPPIQRHDNEFASSNVLAMNNIFDGSNDAVDLDGTTIGSAAERRSASSSTTSSTTTPRTSSRRPTTATSRATSGASLAIPSSSARSGPASMRPPRTSSSSRPRRRSTRAGARSGPSPAATRSIPARIRPSREARSSAPARIPHPPEWRGPR